MVIRRSSILVAVAAAVTLALGTAVVPGLVVPAFAVNCSAPAWAEGTSYGAGDQVTYEGSGYTATTTHTAYPGTGWDPASTPALWTHDGTCDGGPEPEPTDEPTGDPTPDPTPTEPEPDPGTPVAANGQLHVCGVNLCNEDGTRIQLRGMSTHGTQWYSQCVNDESLDTLAYDWNADVVRISTYVQEGGYETDPERFTDLVHRYIDMLTARGMYAIVDWHMLEPGDPHVNLERAKTFFTAVAERHSGKNNIIYEVANEPHGVSWQTIKSYHEEIVPVIRAQDPDAVVLLGTRGWSSLGESEGSDESEVVNDPVDASNVMYTFHFYAATHRDDYLGTLSRAADRIPMFITEFGTQNSAGEGANDFAMAQRYLDLAASKKISWVNWNFSDDHRSGAVLTPGSCAAGTYGTGNLKEAGLWIRDRIRTPDGF
ncbi:cellulase family glycosylhydrolase [Myceligenerans salitolerans]|uniref:cellulase n=1 Tax=Myceligenerans salitolerans TaxID=1230528 RepID=A0ABS3I7N5_9MICO|nr:cellulase family glycosylhydrolase [Myceligenerans salitolerans]MBO0608641.1 cellulase family glycosylhydrolase [Myceligenerans salitolerans]